MEEKNGKNPVLAFTVATVFIAALGVIVYSPAPYKGVRPSVPEIREPSEQIRARLWQDPFQAVLDHVKDRETRQKPDKVAPEKAETKSTDKKTQEQEKPTKPDPMVAGLINFSGCCLLNQRLLEEISERQAKGSVTVLGAMVWGGPYAELVESRIRQRYAVLAGLNRLKFYPEDSDHLGFIKIINKKDDPELCLSNIAPFEWFARDNQKEFVLLLWLNEDIFSNTPLAKLNCIKNLFSCFTLKPKIKIIGPPSSGTLMEMIVEILKEDTEISTDMNIYTATATADYGDLLQKVYRQNRNDLENKFKKKYDVICYSEKEYIKLLEEELKSKIKNKLERTILSDKVLATALIEELRHRGVNLLSEQGEKRDNIALVAEWDSVYGRTFPEIFTNIASERLNLQSKDIRWIRRVSYLRGIDGKLPGEQNETSKEQKNKDNKNKDESDLKNLEEPAGKSQYDYLRRLAENICRLDDEFNLEGKGPIKAIGVLGNDFYDKYLVLQALRQRLPDRIFFTTDLDARYLHPANIEWTRNLVVASTFDLQLSEKLQGDVPPFRDSYQTSVFAAILRAFDHPDLKESDFKDLKPRIFEIGRRNAIDLTDPMKPAPINQALQRSPEMLGKEKAVIIFLLLILAVLLYLCVPSSKKIVIIISVISFTAIYSLLIFYYFLHEEPFYLTEGISVWPTEFIQIIALVLAIFFLIIAINSLNENRDKINREFFGTENTENQVPDDSEDSVNYLWKVYIKAGQNKIRWVAIALFSIIFLCGSIIMTLSFGKPSTPMRGDFIKSMPVIHFFVLFPTLLLFYFLTFFVLDNTQRCRGFINKILALKPIFDQNSLEKLGKKEGMSEKAQSALNDLMIVRLVGKRTEVIGNLIYYPFIIWVIMFLSRRYYFDNWCTPLGLAIVISISALLAWSCTVILRRSAESLRTCLIDRQEQNLVAVRTAELSEEEKSGKKNSEYIETVLNEIKSIRKGAFAPFFQQPALQSLLVPFFGIGGVNLLDFLM